jgi:GH15 family glucan-1,4-alpha-glucosidase
LLERRAAIVRRHRRRRYAGCELAAPCRSRIPAAGDPRFAQTVNAIEGELKRGDFIFRYVEQDDFGVPENAFVICSFWYANALAAVGRRDEARSLFERLLGCRNAHGLLAEHLDPRTGEHWGNFVQTYSMVGLIHSAIRQSLPWDTAF